MYTGSAVRICLFRQIEGEKHVYHLFEDYMERVKDKKELPFMVDALNCS